MLSCFSHVQLCVTVWPVACQVPLSIGFSRQEYWGGLPCPPPGDLRDPGIKPVFLMSPALTGGSLPVVPLGKPVDENTTHPYTQLTLEKDPYVTIPKGNGIFLTITLNFVNHPVLCLLLQQIPSDMLSLPGLLNRNQF